MRLATTAPILTFVAAISTTGLLMAGSVSGAWAQDDHLRCYKIKDSHNFTALADLETVETQNIFPDEAGCKIKVRSKEFCVPVTKTRNLDPSNSKDAPDNLEVSSEALTNDFLCYKVKCPKSDTMPERQLVTDQFGEREISGFVTRKICTPANKIGSTQYKDPGTLQALTSQFITAGPPTTAQLEYLTEPEPEFILSNPIAISSPPGITVISIAENLLKRDCPGGVPMLGVQAFGCTQYWDIELEVTDPLVCVLDGDYDFRFSYGCNPSMPNCDFVNPAEPDLQPTIAVASSDFCPVTTTTTTTMESGGMCLDNADACIGNRDITACSICCADAPSGTCGLACSGAQGLDCTDPTANGSCTDEINAAGCATVCCS